MRLTQRMVGVILDCWDGKKSEARSLALSLSHLLHSLPRLRHLQVALPEDRKLTRIIFGKVFLREPPSSSETLPRGLWWERLESLKVTSEFSQTSRPFHIFVPLLQRANRLRHLELITDFSFDGKSIQNVLSAVSGTLETLSVVGEFPDTLPNLLGGCLRHQTKLKNLLWRETAVPFVSAFNVLPLYANCNFRTTHFIQSLVVSH